MAVVAVELAEGVAAAATAPDDGPISTSNASDTVSHAAPIMAANLPSFGTTVQAIRRD